MKNIYVPHSNAYDFRNELYIPLRASILNSKFNLVFPHEESKSSFNSKEFFKDGNCHYLLAEVSYPSIGLGIELGWANIFGIRTICLIKKGLKLSTSISVLTNEIIEYENSLDLVDKLESLLIKNVLLNRK